MKKILTIILTVVIALFVIGILKDMVIKSVVTVVASKVTGAPVHIDGFSLGVFNQTVKISGLKIYGMISTSGLPKAALTLTNVWTTFGRILTGAWKRFRP